MLEVIDIKKSFGAARAVDGVSFRVSPGSIFGLIGPNGAGKSTIIRMIMNILAPDSGSILFDGVPLVDGHKTKIGYLPEERGLYRKDTVDEILRYLAELKGMSRSAARASIALWLARFDLADRGKAKISELSKGMAQKVQFIASVVHDPALVLFDEPFSGLDPMSQEILLAAMVELKNAGKTVIFSTHIMEHAEKICSEIFMVHRGREVASGKLSELKTKYGRNSVQLEFDGDGAFLRDLPCVESVIPYPRWTEVALNQGSSAQELLAAASARLSLRRFELMEPSLHKIFISLAGGSAEEAIQ
ncbi:MAG: ATP-binding cassette domain-containing protein [Rectinema sp.]